MVFHFLLNVVVEVSADFLPGIQSWLHPEEERPEVRVAAQEVVHLLVELSIIQLLGLIFMLRSQLLLDDMNEFDEFFVSAQGVHVEVNALFCANTDRCPLLNVIGFHLIDEALRLTLGIYHLIMLLALIHEEEIIVVSVKNLLSVAVEWIIVLDIVHDFIVILDDVISGLLVSNNLVRLHLISLLLSQLLHFILDVLLHFAMVSIEEVIIGLHGSDSFLLGMAEIEITFTIIEERMLVILQEFTAGEVTFNARDLLTDQALNMMLLSALDLLHFELETLHASHSMFAFVSSLPSSMHFLVLKIEAFSLTDRVFQSWAWSIMNPWLFRISSLLSWFLVDILGWQLLSKCLTRHQ